MFVFKISIRSAETNLWYIVINGYNENREYTPINRKYENTLIWLHDYNEGVKTASALFQYSKFFAESTKIILPGGPTRDMNYNILGQKQINEHAWYNMNQDFGKHFDDGRGFKYNDVLFSQEDIIDEVEDLMDIVKKEVDYYPDKDLKRIFIGGLSMGGSMALSTYLRYNEKDRLGGIVSLYGVNPLTIQNMESTELQKFTRSKTPILLFNNDYIVDKVDVEYTADYIKETYTKNAALDNYQFI